MKRQTNNLRWKADLLQLSWDVDEDDRPIKKMVKKRDIFYQDIGITAQEKYLSQQAKTDVVRRIKIRLDKSITEKESGITIEGISYNIVRIYTNMDAREMELSLAYVD
ncbi:MULTISPECIES: phage head closure protein [Lactococcus]|uniref:Phage protein n=1 Tax=Lactococcus garvieae TaxID=1363 RepID=A0A6L2ZX87_9LACT|nr:MULTISPECIES: phage head closure protein [Lactococcus]MDN5628833.1 phage head closure protein [Lactococcus sp.]NHI70505.1 phage head-tail joining protein [Lactococcus garvieae]NHJ08303.1 phage head-tail joining protein [Lactococcus garvieae]QQC73720.1 phage head closure protein [Lactococcus garvieae]GFO52305.1 phage protein [Lactococcus garvieae]